MQNWQITLLVLFVAATLAAILKKGSAHREFVRRELMSGAERRLFAILRAEVPAPLAVLAQVRLADLIEAKGGDRQAKRSAFLTISQKHADFVIYDPERNHVLGVIELDGPTHRGRASRKADDVKTAALASAGVPLSRITADEAKNAAAVRQLLAAWVGPSATISREVTGSSG